MIPATIEVPASLTEALAQSMGASALPCWAVKALAVEGVREGHLSTGQAGEFLGLGYFQAEAFLKYKGILAAPSDAEFAQGQADLREIVARLKRG